MWRGVCANPGGSSWTAARKARVSTQACPLATAAPARTGRLPVFSVGRLGGTVSDPNDAADDAIFAMIRAARTTIRLSQQDLLGPALPKLWHELIDELGNAMARGVQVEVLLSTPGSRPNGERRSGYSNGSIEQTLKAVQGRVGARACGKLRVTSLGGKWPSGHAHASHTKAIIVDDRAFYIGSQNLYSEGPAKLAEHGFIVDDAGATQQLLEEYYRPAFATNEGVLTPSCAADGRH
jgi:phosphatidylserine/phosphatidylglycerophosphate/cardiolipin synthase-like enzyme